MEELLYKLLELRENGAEIISVEKTSPISLQMKLMYLGNPVIADLTLQILGVARNAQPNDYELGSLQI